MQTILEHSVNPLEQNEEKKFKNIHNFEFSNFELKGPERNVTEQGWECFWPK